MPTVIDTPPLGFDWNLAIRAIDITEQYLEPGRPLDYRSEKEPNIFTYETVANQFEGVEGRPEDKRFILGIIRDGSERGAAQSIAGVNARLRTLVGRYYGPWA